MIKITFTQIEPAEVITQNVLDLITPVPQHVVIGNGAIIIGKGTTIEISGNPEPWNTFPGILPSTNVDLFPDPAWDLARFSAKVKEWMGVRLDELGIEHPLSTKNPKVDPTPFSGNIPDSTVPVRCRREGYTLAVTASGIEILAWTLRGGYYAILTLSQLLIVTSQEDHEVLACPIVTIHDWPSYPARGLIDDISRGQVPTMDNFKKFIRFLSRSKQNVYVMYIEDVIHFKSHPRIGEDRGKLMPEQVREIQDYAKEWFVSIIPGIELLGHMENILLMPEYIKYAEFPGAACLDVTSPETKEFVKQLLDDAIPQFDSPIFAPICDESMDFGLGKAAGVVQEKGYGKALAEWYLFLIEEIRKRGKPIVFFSHDIVQKFPDALAELKKVDAMVYCWIYANKKTYPAVTRLRKLGLTVAAGPAVFDWSRHYPYFAYAEANMINFGKDALPRGSIGLITTKWGDFHNENFRENIYYGLQVNAQASWTPLKSNVPQIRAAFAWHFFGTTDPRVWECMDTLARQNEVLPRFPNGMFNRFWLDPFVRDIKPAEYKVAERFIMEARHVLDLLDSLRQQGTVTRNADNLDYVSFAARMARHYGAKILISEAAFKGVPHLAEFARGRIGYDGDAVLGGLKWLKEDCKALHADYEILWRRQAVEPGLANPSHRFDILEWHYDQAIIDVESGRKPRAHQLRSDWIWIPGIRSNAEHGNKHWYHFYKAFTTSKPVKKAMLQCISANHAVVSINGKKAGEVVSRVTLGYRPWLNAVGFFDVTGLVRDGANVMCVDAANWGGGVGSLNIVLHLDFVDGEMEDINTDTTWSCTGMPIEPWPFEKVPATEISMRFKRVKSLGKPPMAWQGPITQPVWEKGWKSSISFTFGYRNMIESAVPMFAGRKAYNLLFWLFPCVIKLFGSDVYGLRKQ
ncbi:MAG: glycoside hydrolase family 20 zincin-like fold domain-containing protein [Candidatus Sigynarchaeum springense]